MQARKSQPWVGRRSMSLLYTHKQNNQCKIKLYLCFCFLNYLIQTISCKIEDRYKNKGERWWFIVFFHAGMLTRSLPHDGTCTISTLWAASCPLLPLNAQRVKQPWCHPYTYARYPFHVWVDGWPMPTNAQGRCWAGNPYITSLMLNKVNYQDTIVCSPGRSA